MENLITIKFIDLNNNNIKELKLVKNLNYKQFINKIYGVIKNFIDGTFIIKNNNNEKIWPFDDKTDFILNKNTTYYIQKDEERTCPICSNLMCYHNSNWKTDFTYFNCTHKICKNCRSKMNDYKLFKCPICRSS